MIRYRLSSVPDIGVSTFSDIDDALRGAKLLLYKDRTVSIKIMKEGEDDDQRTETRPARADAEGGEPTGSTGTASET